MHLSAPRRRAAPFSPFPRPPRAVRTDLDLRAHVEQAVALVAAQQGYEGIAFEVSGEAARALHQVYPERQ